MSTAVSPAGRCSRCLGFTTAVGCLNCWPRVMSDAASLVLCEQERYPPLPELITGFVPEEQIPVFQRLLLASVD